MSDVIKALKVGLKKELNRSAAQYAKKMWGRLGHSGPRICQEDFKTGHEAACSRLLPLLENSEKIQESMMGCIQILEAQNKKLREQLEKAVELTKDFTKNRYGAQGYYEESDWSGLADYYGRLNTEFADKARNFLAELERDVSDE